jgi:hypothetical protein
MVVDYRHSGSFDKTLSQDVTPKYRVSAGARLALPPDVSMPRSACEAGTLTPT